MITILIPTNFTDVSRHATDYAIRLFGDQLSRIILLNAFEQPRMGRSLQVSLVDILHRNSRKGLEEDRLRIREEFPELKCDIDTHATQGDLSASIRSLIDSEKIDYMVMGSKGDLEFVDMFMESITARVIKGIDFPMMIVPPFATLSRMDKVIFATDLKEISGPDVVAPMVKLCKLKNLQVKALHIAKSLPAASGPTEKRLKSLFNGLTCDLTVRKNMDIPTGIYKFIHETDADIVVLVKRRGAGNLVARLFHKNVSHRIVKHVKQTLLLLNDQDYPAIS